MRANRKTTTLARVLALGVALVAFTALASGCGQKYSAEKDGKKMGEAICDLKDASTAEEAQSAIADIQKQADDLSRKYSMTTAQDRSAIQEQLQDLGKHQGDDLLTQQDITKLQRNIKQYKQDVDETAQAAWDGVLQGLDDCTS